MNQLVEYILAAMIATISPGMSNYSQVPVERCDATCQVTPRCENPHDFRCKPPTFNKTLYLQKQEELVAHGATQEQAIIDAYELSFTRPETYEEGLARYYVITNAAVDAAKKNTYGVCLAENKCMEKPTDHTGEGSLQECHLECYKTHKWQKRWEDLAWGLAVISSMESGWRSDVQAGTGTYGRGDCAVWWKKETVNGEEVLRKVAAWTDGAYPDRSTCKSYGLNQVWFGNPPKTMSSYTESGITYDEVLGLDRTTTLRSFDLAARYFIMAERICRGKEGVNWIQATFSMYGSGSGCDNSVGRSRAGRYWKWAYKPNLKTLGDKHKNALASAEVKALIKMLEDATSPVMWMPAERFVEPEVKENLVASRD